MYYCCAKKLKITWAKVHILSDSRKHRNPKWLERLRSIDSTTISLFSNYLFKGYGRHPKTGKKKGGIKVHTSIYANEGVPSNVRFTSAATNDIDAEDIVAIYRKIRRLSSLCLNKWGLLFIYSLVLRDVVCRRLYFA